MFYMQKRTIQSNMDHNPYEVPPWNGENGLLNVKLKHVLCNVMKNNIFKFFDAEYKLLYKKFEIHNF